MQDLTMTTNEDGWLAVHLHGSAPGEFPNLLLHNDDILLALSGAEAEVPRFDLPAPEKNLPASLPASPTPPPLTPLPLAQEDSQAQETLLTLRPAAQHLSWRPINRSAVRMYERHRETPHSLCQHLLSYT